MVEATNKLNQTNTSATAGTVQPCGNLAERHLDHETLINMNVSVVPHDQSVIVSFDRLPIGTNGKCNLTYEVDICDAVNNCTTHDAPAVVTDAVVKLVTVLGSHSMSAQGITLLLNLMNAESPTFRPELYLPPIAVTGLLVRRTLTHCNGVLQAHLVRQLEMIGQLSSGGDARPPELETRERP